MKTDYQEALIFLKNRGWLIQTTLVGKKVKFTTYKDEQPLVINGEAKVSYCDFTQGFLEVVKQKHINLYEYLKKLESKN
jgi:hypothetical protein